ncbi:unnamed protein product [Paramecium primaurelia]|uniref:Uncharacterized protein n=2 Tax=Paramecium TaxID=5884 RepID=A0A8S1V3F2_9CILI|nr:unnamed protein product [Paramecium primaurelia]CAD8171471.1 unnamed protein product [Paramecium pentaurelia]
MNLQFQLELKLKDFEYRKLQQQLNVMKSVVDEKAMKFDSIKKQLTETFSALIKYVQLELQNLKKELLCLISTQKQEIIQFQNEQISLKYIQELEQLNQQYYEEKEQFKIRIDKLTKQLIESEKNEVYLMMLNTKYIKENELLNHQLLSKSRQMSQTEQNFYPNKTGFISKFLNKYT